MIDAAPNRRTNRLNSLLKEVISDVIFKDVQDPDIHGHITVTQVEITKDLRQAKVFVSVIGTDQEKASTVEALNRSAGYIGVNAAKQVVIRYFPTLTFKLDNSVESYAKISDILDQIQTDTRS
jgi:ribosome-binding factor A